MSVESPGVLDTCFAQLPLYQVLGDQIHTRFTPLRSYEGFATDLSERAGSDSKFEEEKEKKELKQGLFYIVTSSVEFDPGTTCASPRGLASGSTARSIVSGVFSLIIHWNFMNHHKVKTWPWMYKIISQWNHLFIFLKSISFSFAENASQLNKTRVPTAIPVSKLFLAICQNLSKLTAYW